MTTQTRKLNKTEWPTYFDAISKGLGSTRVNILVGGLDLGLQAEAVRVPLVGLTYDRADDAVEITTEAIGHRIERPSSIEVEEDASGHLVSCEIVDGDGNQQIVQLFPSLRIPHA